MDASLSSALISAAISALVSTLVAWASKRNDLKRDIEAELSEILKIGIKYPYFEQQSFTDLWDPELAKKDERYAAYDLYATLVFNHLEKRSRFCKFDLAKVQDDLDMQSWVRLHARYWGAPCNPHENILGYDVKFAELVNVCLGRKAS